MGENGVTYIYVIEPNGNLSWVKDVGRADNSTAWEGPNPVGVGWNDTIGVFPGAGGVVYSIKPNGDLLKFIHRGILDGKANWAEPDPTRPLATGFDKFSRVFGGIGHIGEGTDVIYAVQPDGTLLWFKDKGGSHLEGPLEGPKRIGSGWNAPFAVFAGEMNIVYTIENGKLFWRKHLGADEGEDSWTEKKVVSAGVSFSSAVPPFRWDQFHSVFAGSPMANFDGLGLQGGFIYLIHPDGRLLRYRHNDWKTGGDGFSEPPRFVGVQGSPTPGDWVSFKRVFAARV